MIIRRVNGKMENKICYKIKRVCYGILNYNRKLENDYFNLIPFTNDIVVCTNNDSLNQIYPNIKTIKANPSCAISKNLILKYAVENNYDYCFIIEDDLKILDFNVFQMYIDLSETYNCAMLFYGFHGNVNKNKLRCGIFNPSVIIKIDNNRTIFVNRNVGGGLMCFRLSEKMTMYDEKLQFFENEYLAYDMSISKEIPFNGFFIDVFESYNYFSRFDLPTVRVKDQKYGLDDLKLRNKIQYHLHLTDFCNYIIDVSSNNAGILK